MAKRRRQPAVAARVERAARPAARPAVAIERRLWEWAKSIAFAVVLFLVIRTFLVQTFVVTSGSMERTLLVGDFLVVSRAAFGTPVPLLGWRIPGYEEPSRGDVVIFRWPHQPGVDVVKRVVGVPGDTLAMRDGVLIRNGRVVSEPYAERGSRAADIAHPWMAWQADYLAPGASREGYRPTLFNWGPLVVPPGRYFVMGDNRDDSLDSRYWGFVERGVLRGRALLIYFSYDKSALVPFAWLRTVRWERIGDLIR